MTKKTIVYLIFIFGIFSFAFAADDDPITAILKKLEEFTKRYPQEKVHLHLDKPYYIAGEDIWLKAYLVTAEKNEVSTLSKILYVELISPTNQIAKKITLAVDSAKAHGQLSIPDTLASGNYRIRAYTNYMRNYDADYFFERFIPIVNLSKVAKAEIKPLKPNLNVQFFPEGGTLIYGLRSKIGIKIVNQDGVGVNVEGDISDQNGEKIASFQTEHAGMGSFAITAVKGQIYHAVVKKTDGSTFTVKLPKIEESGYSLSVNSFSDRENIMVKLAASADRIKGQELSIVGQVNGIVYFTSTAKIDQGVFMAEISKMRFPTGIIQFTVFENTQPVIERLAFNNHFNQIQINITPVRQVGPIDQTTLNFLVTDENNNPIDGNFSVSVTDISKVPFDENDENTILSNLLLTSDLKGFVEQPNYYFYNPNNDKQRQLDNLLLTQGWRRFNWAKLLSDQELPITHPVENTLAISGNITNLNDKPIANGKVILMSVTPGFDLILDTLSDAKGRFTFDRLDVPDSINFMVQAKDGKDNAAVKIMLDRGAKSSEKFFVGNAVNMDAYVANAKSQYQGVPKFNRDGIKLKEVNIVKKTELKPIVNVANSKSRNGSVDYVVSKDRIEHQTGNALDIFNGVPGLKMQDGKIYRTMTNTTSIAPNFGGKPQPVAIILDGAKVDQDVLLTTPASSVEGIEVLVSNYNTAIYEDGYWGVVLVTTKMGGGNPGKNYKSYNVSNVNNSGFTPVKEFYTPAVPVSKTLKAIAKADPWLSTIYWNPNVNSSVSGKAAVRFSNIGPATYRVVIEGMDNYGIIGRKTYSFEVKNESTMN